MKNDIQYAVCVLEAGEPHAKRRAVFADASMRLVEDNDHPEIAVGELTLAKFDVDDQFCTLVPTPDGSVVSGQCVEAFGAHYGIPKRVLEAGLHDKSWHNDMSPSFCWPEDKDTAKNIYGPGGCTNRERSERAERLLRFYLHELLEAPKSDEIDLCNLRDMISDAGHYFDEHRKELIQPYDKFDDYPVVLSSALDVWRDER